MLCSGELREGFRTGLRTRRSMLPKHEAEDREQELAVLLLQRNMLISQAPYLFIAKHTSVFDSALRHDAVEEGQQGTSQPASHRRLEALFLMIDHVPR